MEVKNPSFEEPGTAEGKALWWNEAQTGEAEDIAVFQGVARLYPFEDFEGLWDDNENAAWVFGPGMLSPAMFESGTEPQETFETTWVEPGVVTFPPFWNHQSKWAFSATDLLVALFSLAYEYEGFELEWSDNENSAWNEPGGALYTSNTESGSSGIAFSVLAGQTLDVAVDSAPATTITFLAPATTAVDIATAIDALLAGTRALATTDGRVGIFSDALSGTIQVTGGTANVALQFPEAAPATVTVGSFDVGIPEPVEDFEEEWSSNENAVYGFQPLDPMGGTLGTALFDAGALTYEGFEGIWTETFV